MHLVSRMSREVRALFQPTRLDSDGCTSDWIKRQFCVPPCCSCTFGGLGDWGTYVHRHTASLSGHSAIWLACDQCLLLFCHTVCWNGSTSGVQHCSDPGTGGGLAHRINCPSQAADMDDEWARRNTQGTRALEVERNMTYGDGRSRSSFKLRKSFGRCRGGIQLHTMTEGI